jgi:hypothetical protein
VVITAIAHSTSKPGSGLNLGKPSGRRRKSGTRGGKVSSPADAARQEKAGRPGVRIEPALRAFLESEQQTLMQVESLVVCAKKAMELEPGPWGAYYPDVLGLAADVLRRRVVNLDVLLLDGVVPRETTRSKR